MFTWVKRPVDFDVESSAEKTSFGDIISDLGAGTVGGLGLAPSAEIVTPRGCSQGAHGSAPRYRPHRNVASPMATIFAPALLCCRWLCQRHGDRDSALESRYAIEAAVEDALKEPISRAADLGWTKPVATAVNWTRSARLALTI